MAPTTATSTPATPDLAVSKAPEDAVVLSAAAVVLVFAVPVEVAVTAEAADTSPGADDDALLLAAVDEPEAALAELTELAELVEEALVPDEEALADVAEADVDLAEAALLLAELAAEELFSVAWAAAAAEVLEVGSAEELEAELALADSAEDEEAAAAVEEAAAAEEEVELESTVDNDPVPVKLGIVTVTPASAQTS